MAKSSQFALLRERRFVPFFVTQLTGAFNDNNFKNILLLLATYQAAVYAPGMAPGLVANMAAALFILPFVLFSAIAGQLADRYDKAQVMRVIKVAEVGIMLVAAGGFALKSLPLLLGALFLMGTHSAFFGPVKYSVLPQVLREHELIGGNALVEMGTFLAILAGTLAAGLLVSTTDSAATISAVLVGTAVVGAAASFAVPKTGSAQPELRIRWNPVTETVKLLSQARQNRTVWLSILGISWFWFFGALLLAQFPALAKDALHGDASVVTVLLAVFSVGVALGSMLCERLSGHKVDIGLVPFGSIGLSAFTAHLYFAIPNHLTGTFTAASLLGESWAWVVLFDLFMAAVFGGLFIVPLYALVQTRTPKTHQSRVIAANNIVNALFMVASAGLAAALLAAGATVPQLILVAAGLNAVVALYIYTLVPEFLWRFLLFLAVHSVYRVRAKGIAEAIPQDGPALLVANHVSFVDAFVIQAMVSRPIRFVMDRGIFKTSVLGWFFREARAIPIASAKAYPAVYAAAFDEIDAALKAGELVAIFPEGRLSADGHLGEFRPGYLRVLERTEVPVVAIGLGGLWGSTFSRQEASLLKRPTLKELFRRLGLAAAVVPRETWSKPQLLREAVSSLKRQGLGVRKVPTA